MKPDKKRFLFTGIGLGILFATLVLQAAAHFPQSEPLTRERVESWAKEHGYALVNPDEIGKEAADSSVSPETKVVRETITSIYIVPGMKSQDVERLLVEAGLLEETNDFQEHMRRDQLEKRIRAGLYSFKGKPELEEILHTIAK